MAIVFQNLLPVSRFISPSACPHFIGISLSVSFVPLTLATSTVRIQSITSPLIFPKCFKGLHFATLATSFHIHRTILLHPLPPIWVQNEPKLGTYAIV